jgi:hypothetical protein
MPDRAQARDSRAPFENADAALGRTALDHGQRRGACERRTTRANPPTARRESSSFRQRQNTCK